MQKKTTTKKKKQKNTFTVNERGRGEVTFQPKFCRKFVLAFRSLLKAAEPFRLEHIFPS